MTDNEDPNITKKLDTSYLHISNTFQNPFEDPSLLGYAAQLADPNQYVGASAVASAYDSYNNNPYFLNLLISQQDFSLNQVVEPLSLQPIEDQRLSTIHEPISDHEKRIFELETIVAEFKEKLETKKRKSKTTKRKSKSSTYEKLCKRIEPLEKDASTYRKHWKMAKSIDDMYAKDKETV